MNWSSFLSGSVSVVVVSSFLVWLLRKSIIFALQRSVLKDVEKYKYELSVTKESLRYDLQKNIINAKLQITERHRVYAEAFEKVIIADGAVGGMRGMGWSSTYEEYGEFDIAELLKEQNIPTMKAEEILNKFRSNHQDGLRCMKECFSVLNTSDARQKCTDAKNYLFLKKLYLSKEVSVKMKHLLDQLHMLWFDYRFDEPPSEQKRNREKKLSEDVTLLLDDLEDVMRCELESR